MAGVEYIISGGVTSTGKWLKKNDIMHVSSGGSIKDTIVGSNASAFVYDGGVASITSVYKNGRFELSGGSAVDTIVSSGGYMAVSKGGVARDTTLRLDGSLQIKKGGTANGITAETGGIIGVSEGGQAADVKLTNAYMVADDGAIVRNVTLNSGATLYVAESIATQVVVSKSYLEINSNGVAAMVDLRGGSMGVGNGANITNTNISSGGMLYVGEAGSATLTNVSSGGKMYTDEGSFVYRTTVSSGGSAVFQEGTYVSGLKVLSGATVMTGEEVMLTGNINIASGAKVVTGEGSVVNIDISNKHAGSGVSVNDMTRITGLANYMVTVDSEMDHGTYRLAGNASEFSGYVQIVNEYDSVLGYVSFDVPIFIGETKYVLDIYKNDLVLRIGDLFGPREDDINGDGLADIVMINPDREVGVWVRDASGGATWVALSDLPGTWDVFDVTSINGDKYGDVVLYDRAHNSVGVWYIDENLTPSWSSVGDLDAGDELILTADLDGDSVAELLYRKENGSVGVIYLNSTGSDAEFSLGSDYEVVGAGDVNGDYTEELILRKDNTVYSWNFADGAPVLNKIYSVASENQIVGVADVTGDGMDDIIFNTNGAYGAWVMENGSVVGWKDLGNISGDFILESIGDMDLDGIADMRFRRGSELIVNWVKEAGTKMEVIGEVDPSWRTEFNVKAGSAIRNDINGDGIADIIMANSENMSGAWLMSAKGEAQWLQLSELPENWGVYDVANLNNDQFADVILYNNVSREIGAWFIDSNGCPAWQSVAILEEGASLVGAGDVNGDGVTDFVTRAADGTITFKYLDGFGVENSTPLPAEWEIAGVADINGDGCDDLIMRNCNSVGAWLMNSDGVPAWKAIASVAAVNEIAGFGDVNGDGTDDVIFNTNGVYGAWVMKNGTAAEWFSIDAATGCGELQAISDYNGDGIDDLCFRNENEISIVKINYKGVAGKQEIGSVEDGWNTLPGCLA